MIPLSRSTGEGAMWYAIFGLALTAPLHVLTLLDIDPGFVALITMPLAFLPMIPAIIVLARRGQEAGDWTGAFADSPVLAVIAVCLFLYNWLTGMLNIGVKSTLTDARIATSFGLTIFWISFVVFFNALRHCEWSVPRTPPERHEDHPPEHGGAL